MVAILISVFRFRARTIAASMAIGGTETTDAAPLQGLDGQGELSCCARNDGPAVREESLTRPLRQVGRGKAGLRPDQAIEEAVLERSRYGGSNGDQGNPRHPQKDITGTITGFVPPSRSGASVPPVSCLPPAHALSHRDLVHCQTVPPEILALHRAVTPGLMPIRHGGSILTVSTTGTVRRA